MFVDTGGGWFVVSATLLSRHWIFVSEYMYRVLQPTDSAQQVTVVDMKGVRIQVNETRVDERLYLSKPLADSGQRDGFGTTVVL